MVKFGGPVDQSLRRRGQLLVVVGALLGALIGVTLGLAVEDAATSRAAAAPGRGAALAASRPGSQPSASRTAGAERRTAGHNTAPGQDGTPPERSGKQHGNAPKDGKGGRDKPAKDNHGKHKDKGK